MISIKIELIIVGYLPGYAVPEDRGNNDDSHVIPHTTIEPERGTQRLKITARLIRR
jgi:hypothetical protein